MRTSLYNPIFINPQGYYVFPQLYHTERKEDDFIEQSIFAGRLLVKDVNNPDDYETFENTREIDLSSFAGKLIQIEQYTNIGDTVLGRFQLGELPFHKSLVDVWFMSGYSNEDKPTSITGVKGNELQLKNFAYSLSSGFGKYSVDFNNFYYKNAISRTSSHLVKQFDGLSSGNRYILCDFSSKDIPSMKIKITHTNLNNTGDIARYVYISQSGTVEIINLNFDEEYTLPNSYAVKNGTTVIGFQYLELKGIQDTIELTQYPEDYQGALVFDGVDDYCISDNQPILTDYTVIARREWITTNKVSALATKRLSSSTPIDGAFTMEQVGNDADISSSSFGGFYYTNINDVIDTSDQVVTQTKSTYNNVKNIVVGSNPDTNTLSINQDIAKLTHRSNNKLCVYYFALYNKSLTPEEIEIEKERLHNEWFKRLNNEVA